MHYSKKRKETVLKKMMPQTIRAFLRYPRKKVSQNPPFIPGEPRQGEQESYELKYRTKLDN